MVESKHNTLILSTYNNNPIWNDLYASVREIFQNMIDELVTIFNERKTPEKIVS
jgi:hypothetical protein